MTPPPAGDSSRALINRISSLLPDRQLREVRMFGVLALMVDGAMAVAAHKDGSLLVRVNLAEDARLGREPGGIPRRDGPRSLNGQGLDPSRSEDAAQQRVLAGRLETATRYVAQREPAPSSRAC